MSGEQSNPDSLEGYRERDVEADLRYRRSLAWFALIVPLLVVAALLIILLVPAVGRWLNE